MVDHVLLPFDVFLTISYRKAVGKMIIVYGVSLGMHHKQWETNTISLE